MATIEELKQAASAAWSAVDRPERPLLRVTRSTCSTSRGADETFDRLQSAIAAGLVDCDLGITGCTGLCFLEPTITVFYPDGTIVLYGEVAPELAHRFLEETILQQNHAGNFAIATLRGTVPSLIPIEQHIFWRQQVRRLMAICGLIDPESLDHYLAHDGYQGLARALTLSQGELIKRITDSGLWGRGGAAFSTGRKWEFLQTARRTPKYIVCNADEGDPGAFVNRTLLESDPHSTLEGMIVAGWATGAEMGYIYIREEYPLAVERVRHAVAQLYERGLLGDDILGSGFHYDIRVVRGAGSYVCGEETGLISSIQDSRGMPRIKPPFPANAGLWGLPTNVNNVETLANVPWIMRNGGHLYRQMGTERNPGTKMFSFSGDIQRVGVLEVPFGVSMRRILTENAGGWPEGRSLKAIQPGGPLGGILPAQALDLALEPEPFRAYGTLMGSGGIIPFDDSTCMVDMAMYFTWFAEDESCGRCTTCHGGTQRMTEILRRIQAGDGRMGDIDLLKLTGDTLRWSNCVHGQAAPTAVQNCLSQFLDEFLMHIREKRCPAQVCRGLIRYEVVPEHDTEAAAAAAICPTGAVKESGGRYAIDQSLCIKCGACIEQSPQAVRLVDANARPASGTLPGELIPLVPAAAPAAVGGD